LNQLVTQLSQAMGARPVPIRIEGHTDNTPIATSQYPSNWELSTARATHIVRYLVESGRWSPEKISAVGYGEFRPLVQNSSIEGKRKNRRVDIVILNEGSVRQEAPSL
jgi:chemotaxis protein MotB